MSFKVKKGTKILLGYGIIGVLAILAILIGNIGIVKSKQALKLSRYTDELKSLLYQEQTALLQFMVGADKGEEGYKQAHNQIAQLVSNLEKARFIFIPEMHELQAYVKEEQEIYNKLFGEKDGFFIELREAEEGFIDKNNKHVRRLLGYRNGWVLEGSEKDNQVLILLDAIRSEYILLLNFDPRSGEAEDTIDKFRETNNFVVDGLTKLWQQELSDAIDRSEDGDIAKKLEAVKRIVGEVTATSFPPISEAEATLIHISGSNEIRYGEEADNATKELTKSCESIIKTYEQDRNIVLWLRADVSDVGQNVTPTETLGKIVSCQQGLRVNAEDIFRWKITYVNDIEPLFTSLNRRIDTLNTTVISSLVHQLSIIQYFSLVVALLLVLFLIIYTVYINRTVSE